MTERDDNLQYQTAEFPSTREGTETNLFLTGPGEFLVREICTQLKAIEIWRKIFGEFIDPYLRMDYQHRNLPAMRCYVERWNKNSSTWYINGTIKIDIIYPASLRRQGTFTVPNTVVTALMQQFEDDSFFNALREKVPGLNELGKTFDADMTMDFNWGDENVPFTRASINYRINKKEWDDYLISDNRTTDSPFERTLGDLEQVAVIIDGLRDTGESEVTIGIDIDLTQP